MSEVDRAVLADLYPMNPRSSHCTAGPFGENPTLVKTMVRLPSWNDVPDLPEGPPPKTHAELEVYRDNDFYAVLATPQEGYSHEELCVSHRSELAARLLRMRGMAAAARYLARHAKDPFEQERWSVLVQLMLESIAVVHDEIANAQHLADEPHGRSPIPVWAHQGQVH